MIWLVCFFRFFCLVWIFGGRVLVFVLWFLFCSRFWVRSWFVLFRVVLRCWVLWCVFCRFLLFCLVFYMVVFWWCLCIVVIFWFVCCCVSFVSISVVCYRILVFFCFFWRCFCRCCSGWIVLVWRVGFCGYSLGCLLVRF